LTPQRLRAAGYNEDEVQEIVRHCRDGLANLQLLQGGENIGKNARLPLEWATKQYPHAQALDAYLVGNDMKDVPADLDGFLIFYQARRDRMVERLSGVLGRSPGSLEEHSNTLVTVGNSAPAA
jgi:hypothetical protein